MKTQNSYSTPTGAVVTELADLPRSGRSSDMRNLPTGLDPAPKKPKHKDNSNREVVNAQLGQWRDAALKDADQFEKQFLPLFNVPPHKSCNLWEIPRHCPPPALMKMIGVKASPLFDAKTLARLAELQGEFDKLRAYETAHSNDAAKAAFNAQQAALAEAIIKGEQPPQAQSRELYYEQYVNSRRSCRRQEQQIAFETFGIWKPAFAKLRDAARAMATERHATEKAQAAEFGLTYTPSAIVLSLAWFGLRGWCENSQNFTSGMSPNIAAWFPGLEIQAERK